MRILGISVLAKAMRKEEMAGSVGRVFGLRSDERVMRRSPPVCWRGQRFRFPVSHWSLAASARAEWGFFFFSKKSSGAGPEGPLPIYAAHRWPEVTPGVDGTLSCTAVHCGYLGPVFWDYIGPALDKNGFSLSCGSTAVFLHKGLLGLKIPKITETRIGNE